MKPSTIALCAVSVLLGNSARAQVLELEQSNQPVIAVVGDGSASRPADYATLGFSYRGEGRSQTEALQALKDVRARVDQGLNNLAGVTGVRIQPSQLKVQEVWSKGCGADEDHYPPTPSLARPGCTVDGYVATTTVSAEIAPADVSANAASLASQLGAVDVELEGGDVHDPSALEAAAAKAALANAQAKAEAIAAATGVRLGLVLRIQDQRTGSRLYRDVVVTGSRIAGSPVRPAVELDLPPPPVTREAQFTVIYGIQR